MSIRFEGVPDDLDGPLLKVERAEKHAQDLIALIKDWIALPPHTIVSEDDPANPGRIKTTIERIEDVPVDVPLIVGDIVYNLGSALDQLICVLQLRCGASRCRKTNFPFGKDADDVKTRLGEIKSLHAPNREIIEGLQPFEDGEGRTLWALWKLYNHDKHRMLMTFAAAAGIDFRSKLLYLCQRLTDNALLLLCVPLDLDLRA